MKTTAIITKPGKNFGESAADAQTAATAEGCVVKSQLPNGTLVQGTPQSLESLQKLGYRVKLLPNTHLLRVGPVTIDIEAAPPVLSQDLTVGAGTPWRHHLVQCIAPPIPEWRAQISQTGASIIELVGPYGLYVLGSPDQLGSVAALPFVAWTGPFQPAYRVDNSLAGKSGMIKYVRILALSDDGGSSVSANIRSFGAKIAHVVPPETADAVAYAQILAEVDSSALAKIASIPDVRWLEFASPTPGLDGERETQIVAESLVANQPVVGYQAVLANLGINGAGVRIAICDTGIDAGANNNVSGHLDIRGRQAAFVDYTGGATTTDTDGHGTHVAGIAVGNAATGQTEAAAPNNFLWGQGMAPGSTFVGQNALMGPWPPANYATLTTDAITQGANVMNNSWWSGAGTGSGYSAASRLWDRLSRDPNPGTAAVESLAIVFSSGNAGPNASTITDPKETKNTIVVGNSLTFRPGVGDVDNINGMRASSSRGPAVDGRILPTVCAPGTNVSSIWSETGDTGKYGNPIAGTGNADPANPGSTINQYLYMSGTSMAAPHVSGLCALLIEWWRGWTNNKTPSQAMLKALLVNGAIDMQGGPSGRTGAGGVPIPLANIPNNDQGWGRVSLDNMVEQAPASDRGPKLFVDQKHAFTASGQEYMIRIAAADAARPIRITLTWTDAPATAGANPALVNDLDLEVTQVATGTVFRGNVFANGFSTPGGAFDALNNVECVYLQNPNGVYEVRVLAGNIAANARPPFDLTPWQDFALVLDNAQVPLADPISVVPVVDRSGSMSTSGYVDITRTATNQFIDMLGVDDRLAVVSFGSVGTVEYPTGASPTVQTITGAAEQTAAKAEVTGMGFGGCTYMGDGINKAAGLLAGATGERAIVLLSDGYDNKGCAPTDPTRDSAITATTNLPDDVRVYSCAMGPMSDQGLLEDIADLTGGRYYYMPTILDLFEIYNYIRGQVTGDSVVVNESSMASSSQVAGFVDALADRASFCVAWHDPALRYVTTTPKKPHEVMVRLRDPKGRLLSPNSAFVRRVVGDRYVIFHLPEPMPGKWHVQVDTHESTHTGYTVGGFVDSSIRMRLIPLSKKFVVGAPIQFATQIFDGKIALDNVRATAVIAAPAWSLADLVKKYKGQLATIAEPQGLGNDTLPAKWAKLGMLRDQLIQRGQGDIFAPIKSAISMGTPPVAVTPTPGRTFPHVINSGRLTHRLGGLAFSAHPGPVGAESDHMLLSAPVLSLHRGSPFSGAAFPLKSLIQGKFVGTKIPGSYNAEVVVSGVSAATGTKFVRKEMISFVVK